MMPLHVSSITNAALSDADDHSSSMSWSIINESAHEQDDDEGTEWDLASLCTDVSDWAALSLDQICKGDLTEVKSLAKPPRGVQDTAAAVCIAFGRPGTWASAKY